MLTKKRQRLNNIIKDDSLLKELASKLAEVKPILDKMENEVKSKQENKKKEKEEEGVEEARDIGNEVRTEGDEENGRE